MSMLLCLIPHLFNAHFNIVFLSMLTSTKFFSYFQVLQVVRMKQILHLIISWKANGDCEIDNFNNGNSKIRRADLPASNR